MEHRPGAGAAVPQRAFAECGPDAPTLLANPQSHSLGKCPTPRYTAASCLATYCSPKGRRNITIARATKGAVCVLSPTDFTLNCVLPFPNDLVGSRSGASPATELSVQCVAIGEGPGEIGHLIVAALGSDVAVWSAISSSHSSTSHASTWRLHSQLLGSSTKNPGDEVTSLDIFKDMLLVGTTTSISIYRVIAQQTPNPRWVLAWQKRTPAPIQQALFSPAGECIAASTIGDNRVLVWAIQAAAAKVADTQGDSTSTTCQPSIKLKLRLTNKLRHSRVLTSFAWRIPTDTQSQALVLVTNTSEGAARIWAPVIDEPEILRLWATVDPASFGLEEDNVEQDKALSGDRSTLATPQDSQPVVYLDASLIVHTLGSHAFALERDLQMAQLSVGASVDDESTGVQHSDAARDKAVLSRERLLEKKRTRLQRLKHLISDTPDMFMRIQRDGSIVIRAVTNVDRRPPTLLETYTVLKLPSAFPVAPIFLASLRLAPLTVPPSAPSDCTAAVIYAETRGGAELVFDMAPSRFFEGDGGGLTLRGGRNEPAPCASHSRDITQLQPSADGSTLLSEASPTELCEWSVGRAKQPSGKVLRLKRRIDGVHCVGEAEETARRVTLAFLPEHRGIVVLDRAGIHVRWKGHGKDQVLQGLPCDPASIAHIGAVGEYVFACLTDGMTISWVVAQGGASSVKAEKIPFEDGGDGGVIFFSVPPTRSSHSQPNCAVVGTLSTTGVIQLWALNTVAHPHKASWTCTSRLQTSIRGAELARSTSAGLVAIAKRDAQTVDLSIWNTREAMFTSGLELRETLHLSAETTSLPISLSWSAHSVHVEPLLAIACSKWVRIYGQQISSTSSPNIGPASSSKWSTLTTVDIARITSSPIGAIAWLRDLQVAVASSNQVLLYGPLLAHPQRSHQVGLNSQPTQPAPARVEELAARSSGPLLHHHPDFILQVMLWGKLDCAKRIIVQLARILADNQHLRDEQETSELLRIPGLPSEAFHAAETVKADDTAVEEDSRTLFARPSIAQQFSQEVVSQLLNDLDSPLGLYVGLNAGDLARLKAVIQTTLEVDEQSASLDENGLRYLVALRSLLASAEAQAQTAKGPLHQTSSKTGSSPPHLAHRDIIWAFHSDSQERLLTLLSQSYPSRFSWAAASATGCFLWIRDQPALNSLAELVARTEYLAGDDRDPVRCSLLYYALGKAKLVYGLWKQAVWHPEQKKMLAFLGNDFSEARWRSAAKKNAFALLSQRRFEFAASFFLLGDSLSDAVSVCVQHLNDLPLAITLARLGEGRTDGPVFTDLLRKRVLPHAFRDGDRWLASWAFWMLNKRDLAVRVVVTPLSALLVAPDVTALLPDLAAAVPSAGDDATNDAMLALLFARLKSRTLQTLQGTAALPERTEWEFVLHCNRVLIRMGCPLLGLSLLRDWIFEVPELTAAPSESPEEGAIASASPVTSPIRVSLDGKDPFDSVIVGRSRRRSSLMQRRSSIINDLVAEPALVPSKEPVPVGQSTIFETVPAPPAASNATTGSTEGGERKLKGLGSLMKAATASTKQGGQDFNFDSFAF